MSEGPRPARRGSKAGSTVTPPAFEELLLEVEVADFEEINSTIVYKINMTCRSKDIAWSIDKRYNDFHALHNVLMQSPHCRGVRLPELPPKSFWLTSSSRQELTQQRMQGFQDYLEKLTRRSVFIQLSPIRKFLNMPTEVRQLAIDIAQRQNLSVMKGWMLKKGARNPGWRRRWFVLQPNHILKYFKGVNSREPQGAIDCADIVNVTLANNVDHAHAFTVIARERTFWLACDKESERRQWMQVLTRIIDEKNVTGAPTALDNSTANIGLHDQEITSLQWSPVVPGILATSGKDGFIKIWRLYDDDTTELDSRMSLYPAGDMYSRHQSSRSATTPQDIIEEDETESEHVAENGMPTQSAGLSQPDHLSGLSGHDDARRDQEERAMSDDSTDRIASQIHGVHEDLFPVHNLHFEAIDEFKTAGPVMNLEWSPDGKMIVASIRKYDSTPDRRAQFFLQCVDAGRSIATSWRESMDDDDYYDGDGDRTRVFTLQDYPSQLGFSRDGSRLYMSMSIDPNSDDNERRRPAFLVFLDLVQNQLHRCKIVDRIIDHQTETVVQLSINRSRNVMVVATTETTNRGRLIVWDMETDDNAQVIERAGDRVESITWSDDDQWLIVGRVDGSIHFFRRVHRVRSEKGTIEKKDDVESDDEDVKTTENGAPEKIQHPPEYQVRHVKQQPHFGPVYNLTCSNGILISSARPMGVAYEDGPYFSDIVLWDLRRMMVKSSTPPHIVTRLNKLNGDNDITRLLEICPPTTYHSRSGVAPGSLLAATGNNLVYCHNMLDLLLYACFMAVQPD